MENYRFVSLTNINTLGTLFGGDLLRWFDSEAALFAYECLSEQESKRMTSICVYAFNFIKPAYQGNRIRSRWEIVHVGRTSITVKGIYEAWQSDDDDLQKWIIIAQGYSCLCVIDVNGKPTTCSLKPEINFEEIKSNKEWRIVQNFKALTRLS